MTDTLTLTMDGAEAHVLEAALAIYRKDLTVARDLGGPATDAAVVMDGPAKRVQARLHDLLYGTGEPVEPDWAMPESADPITAAKALRFDDEGTLIPGEYPDPEVMPYHDWQADPNVEGMPEFNGSFR